MEWEPREDLGRMIWDRMDHPLGELAVDFRDPPEDGAHYWIPRLGATLQCNTLHPVGFLETPPAVPLLLGVRPPQGEDMVAPRLQMIWDTAEARLNFPNPVVAPHPRGIATAVAVAPHQEVASLDLVSFFLNCTVPLRLHGSQTSRHRSIKLQRSN